MLCSRYFIYVISTCFALFVNFAVQAADPGQEANTTERQSVWGFVEPKTERQSVWGFVEPKVSQLKGMLSDALEDEDPDELAISVNARASVWGFVEPRVRSLLLTDLVFDMMDVVDDQCELLEDEGAGNWWCEAPDAEREALLTNIFGG